MTQRLTLGSGDERIELRPARGQHGSAMMLAWLPAHRLLYVSDVLVPDAFEPVFTAAYRAELARIVSREGFAVDRVFAEHIPATSSSDVVGCAWSSAPGRGGCQPVAAGTKKRSGYGALETVVRAARRDRR